MVHIPAAGAGLSVVSNVDDSDVADRTACWALDLAAEALTGARA